MSDVTLSHEPHDRLTRLCALMTDAMELSEDHGDDVKAVIMLDDGKHGGIVIHGYAEGNEREAFVDLFVHLKAMADGFGMRLELIGIPDSPEGL